MIRHTLATAAIVLSTAATQVQAGPGCMNGKQAMGWHPQQQMYGPGYRGHSPMPGYGGPMYGMAMPRYSPMMAGAQHQGQYAPAPAVREPQYASSPVRDSKDTPAAENVTVRIKGMRFEPAVVKVKPGTTVTWIQEDGAPHTITGTRGVLNSSTLTGGQSYTHTFSEAGSYNYACNFHPMMKGEVVVEDSAS